MVERGRRPTKLYRRRSAGKLRTSGAPHVADDKRVWPKIVPIHEIALGRGRSLDRELLAKDCCLKWSKKNDDDDDDDDASGGCLGEILDPSSSPFPRNTRNKHFRGHAGGVGRKVKV